MILSHRDSFRPQTNSPFCLCRHIRRQNHADQSADGRRGAASPGSAFRHAGRDDARGPAAQPRHRPLRGHHRFPVAAAAPAHRLVRRHAGGHQALGNVRPPPSPPHAGNIGQRILYMTLFVEHVKNMEMIRSNPSSFCDWVQIGLVQLCVRVRTCWFTCGMWAIQRTSTRRPTCWMSWGISECPTHSWAPWLKFTTRLILLTSKELVLWLFFFFAQAKVNSCNLNFFFFFFQPDTCKSTRIGGQLILSLIPLFRSLINWSI